MINSISPEQHFFNLTPDKVLDAIELFSVRCSGRVVPLNSMENRVYEVEIENQQAKHAYERFRVAKFYRPGRWSKEQILAEHSFLFELEQAEVPVVCPLKTEAGESVLMIKDTNIFYALFPKVAGRIEPEISSKNLEQIGRQIARIHAVGSRMHGLNRISLSAQTYGRDALKELNKSKPIPVQLEDRYMQVAEQVVHKAEQALSGVKVQPIHADLHPGNVLWRDLELRIVDFDDCLIGPVVQDLWLLLPGRGEEVTEQREALLRGYELMREFDRETLSLVEHLRALRMIHFSAWISKRWDDPSFQGVFANFKSERYWMEQIETLSEQLGYMP